MDELSALRTTGGAALEPLGWSAESLLPLSFQEAAPPLLRKSVAWSVKQTHEAWQEAEEGKHAVSTRGQMGKPETRSLDSMHPQQPHKS